MLFFRMDLQLMAMGKPEDDAIVFNNPKGKEAVHLIIYQSL